MKTSDRASFLAGRIRHVMETRAGEAYQVGGANVCSAGMVWRDGFLKFVVQTDSIEKVGLLREQLPDDVEGFPVVIEVEGAPTALDCTLRRSGSGVGRTRSLWIWRRLLRLLGCQKDWLATIARHPSEFTSGHRPEPR
jgi:hypothetical protein